MINYIAINPPTPTTTPTPTGGIARVPGKLSDIEIIV